MLIVVFACRYFDYLFLQEKCSHFTLPISAITICYTYFVYIFSHVVIGMNLVLAILILTARCAASAETDLTPSTGIEIQGHCPGVSEKQGDCSSSTMTISKLIRRLIIMGPPGAQYF